MKKYSTWLEERIESGKCMYCGTYKKNALGMCPNCFKFPTKKHTTKEVETELKKKNHGNTNQ